MSGTYVARPPQQHKENPFMEQALASVDIGNGYTAFAKAPTLADVETGELMEGNLFGFRKKCDKAEFVKIYKDGIKAIFKLPTGAVNVLGVLLQEYRRSNTVKDREAYIELSYRAACVDHEYKNKQKTWIAGLNHLIVQGIIAASVVPNRFYINPAYFFKGNRYTFVREYCLEKFSGPNAAKLHGPNKEVRQ